jgi:hypothetical protein
LAQHRENVLQKLVAYYAGEFGDTCVRPRRYVRGALVAQESCNGT